MEFLTGAKGRAHFTSAHFRALLQCIFGKESYIAHSDGDITPEILTGNVIRIPSLMLIHHGGLFFVEDSDEVVYQNGSQSMKRIDLIVARYTKTSEGIENGEWAIITGTSHATTPTAPAYTEGDMQNGDLVDECPVFKVTYDGLNIESIKCLVPFIKALCNKQNQIQAVSELPSDGTHGDVCIVVES